MRILISAIFIIAFYHFLPDVGIVSAQVVNNAWVVSSSICQQSQGLYEISDSQIKDSSKIGNTKTYIEERNLCTVDPNIEIWNVTSGWLDFCPPDKVIARKYGGGYYSSCCPRDPIGGYEFTYSFQSHAVCCPFETSNYNVSLNRCNFGDGTYVTPQSRSTTTYSVAANQANFKVGSETFYCPLIGCLTDNSVNANPVTNNTINTPLTLAQRSGLECYASRSDKPGDPNLECFNNQWLPPEEIEEIDGVGQSEQCLLLRDDTERNRCLECFKKNDEARANGEPESFVYSSLGCIDTRRNPFITRLFQIGFGLLGGFAIIMIMWGSIQRQSTDPAKIQEGWDKIKAAIASIVMLASAIPLLRFLGINLTGLLPFNIFN